MNESCCDCFGGWAGLLLDGVRISELDNDLRCNVERGPLILEDRFDSRATYSVIPAKSVSLIITSFEESTGAYAV